MPLLKLILKPFATVFWRAVAPGPVKTNIEAPMKSSLAATRIGGVLPPFARSEQLVACITWLSSDDSTNFNGVVLASDGGWSAL